MAPGATRATSRPIPLGLTRGRHKNWCSSTAMATPQTFSHGLGHFRKYAERHDIQFSGSTATKEWLPEED
jgi:hypothetical protein